MDKARAFKNLDPITLAVVSGAIDSMLREMSIAMRKAAMSPVLAIGNDFSNAICDWDARMVAQGNDQPVHLGGIMFATKAVARYFGDDIARGDVIYHNDPRTGGSHLPDMTLYRPVFFEDELMFWAVNRSHMNETGGPVAGGYNPLAEEIWAEGLRISPLKIYERGKARRDVIDLLLTNLRTRRIMQGDLGAQLAATGLAEQRLLTIFRNYGTEQTKLCIEYMLNRAEELMRREIGNIPDGLYCGHAVVEDDERGSGDLDIRCEVGIEGDRMTVSVDSPPVVRSYINSYAPNSIGAVYLGVLTYVDPTLPHCEGLYRPIDVDLGRQGTLVNATEPAACGLSTNTPFENIVDAVRDALSNALPERAGGAWAHACVNSIFGRDPRHNESYAYYSHMTGWGGGGAMTGKDGEPSIGSIGAAAAAMTGDVEAVEHMVPVHIRRYELETDSGNPGKWRGGLGAVFEFDVVDHDAVLSQFGDGMTYPAASVLTKTISPYNKERVFKKFILRGAARVPDRVSLHCVRSLHSNETMIIHCAGGGAVGPAWERDLEAVRSDVIDDYVSLERAQEEYGVVLAPRTIEIDVEATTILRSQLAQHATEAPLHAETP